MAREGTGTADLRKLIRTVGKLPKDAQKDLRKPLRAAGRKAQLKARFKAKWSKRIPGAIGLRVSFARRRPGVSLVVNRKKAPHARAYENLGRRGTFRHPAFGSRWRWVSQRSRPFLFPAALEAFEQMDADIGQAVDAVARKHGLT